MGKFNGCLASQLLSIATLIANLSIAFCLVQLPIHPDLAKPTANDPLNSALKPIRSAPKSSASLQSQPQTTERFLAGSAASPRYEKTLRKDITKRPVDD